ncbi:MAG: M48 family metallopeptidase [Verrucomicrobia bacterium]|nr:M48 family metallopeptidase [Verrucomicrobiota bacterium]
MELPQEYIIERKAVRHARINVNEKKEVRFIIPKSFSEDEIQRLIVQKSDWIKNKLAFFEKEEILDFELPKANILYLGEAHPKPKTDVVKWYRTEAKNYLTKRTEFLAKKYNFKYNRLFVRDSKNKWGNCSKEKNISLNWRLIKAPPQVIDYVILHELCHSVILKHTQAFWLKLSTVCPSYNEQAEWLKKYGKSLF